MAVRKCMCSEVVLINLDFCGCWEWCIANVTWSLERAVVLELSPYLPLPSCPGSKADFLSRTLPLLQCSFLRYYKRSKISRRYKRRAVNESEAPRQPLLSHEASPSCVGAATWFSGWGKLSTYLRVKKGKQWEGDQSLSLCFPPLTCPVSEVKFYINCW